MTEKPPYRISSMAEIQALPWNGLRVASTFSGAGGSCLGYRMAGFRVIWASEFVEAAQEAYRLNHSTHLDTRDLREVTAADILSDTGLGVGELDVLEGSPPCSAFSTCGVREKGWGEVKQYSSTRQRVDDLFYEYARLVRGLQPRVFVAENVPALSQGKSLGYFKAILTELRSCGYRVRARILNALWLGVPQNRERLIFIGVREDLGLEPVFPKPLAYFHSVREALSGTEDDGTAWMLPKGKMLTLYRCAGDLASGGRFNTIHKRIWGGESFFNHRRLFWDLPAFTIVQGSRSAYHPDVPRCLTTAELKRLSSFPDDFEVTGSPAQQWERIGRAVPPLMMRAVAESVHQTLTT